MTTTPDHSDQGEPSPAVTRVAETSPLHGLSSEAVLEHADWLRRLARGLVNDVHDAEDLVQEAFGVLASARGPIRNLRAYLAQTLRFQGAKRLRSHSRRKLHESLSADLEPKFQEAEDRVAERMDAMRLVLEEVERLPRAQSRAIGLHYVDGLTVAEVSKRLGVEASTVRAQLARGRATLRAKLDRECGGTEAWSLLLVPWCFPDAMSAAASGTLVSPTAPTAGTTSVGMVTGGIAFMTLAKSTLVLVPVIAGAAWLALRTPASLDESGKTTSLVEQDPASTIAEPNGSAGSIELAEPSGRGRMALAAPGRTNPASAAPKTFPIQGRIVRDADGRPLDGVEVSLQRDPITPENDAIWKAVTGQNGEFIVPSGSWTEGDAKIFVKDGPYYIEGQGLTLAFPFEQDISVACGPTLEFRYRGEHVDPRLPSKVSILSGAGSDPWVIGSLDTRQGPLPWVRLTEIPPAGTADVRIVAEGDFVFGEGRIEEMSGLDRRPIDIEFEMGGALEFRLAHDEPSSFMKVVLSKLDTDSASPKNLGFSSWQGEQEKVARDTHVSAGRYRWDLKFGSVDVGGEVEVKPGEWTRVTVGAESVAGLGIQADATVEIDVRAAPDVDLTRWQIGVMFEEDPTQGVGGSLRAVPTEDPNRWTVTVKDLSEGKWVLFMKPEPGFEVTPLLVPLVPGGAPPVATVTRAAELIPVTLRVVDDETGEPITGASVAHSKA